MKREKKESAEMKREKKIKLENIEGSLTDQSSQCTSCKDCTCIEPLHIPETYNNIKLENHHGVEVTLHTKKLIPNAIWRKAECTLLNNHDDGKISMACLVDDFDNLDRNLESRVAFALDIHNSSSKTLGAKIYLDQQHADSLLILPKSNTFIDSVLNSGHAYPLFIKQHITAQDDSEIDHNFLSVMGSIKLSIEEIEYYQEEYPEERDEIILEKRFTSVKVGSLKSSSMSIDFGQPIPGSYQSVVAKCKEPFEFDIKYRNKTGYLLLLVQAGISCQGKRIAPEVIEID